jgi:methyl-accepting chemotaxis protein
VKHWSIGNKLGAALSSLAAIILGFSVLALFQMARINDSATQVADRWLPLVRQGAALEMSLAEMRLFQWRHLTADSPATLEDAERQMKDTQAKFETTRRDYVAMVRASDHQDDLKPFNQVYTELEAHTARWLDDSRAGRKAQALAYFKGPTRKAYDTAREMLGQVVARNAAGSSAAQKAAEQDYKWSIGLTVIAIVAALALAGAATFFLRGAIARPVRAMTEAMTALAAGDLSVEVPAFDRRDEIGALAAAMARFKQAVIEAQDKAHTLAVVDRIGQALAALAKGDLTHRLDDSVDGDFIKLRNDFNAATDTLRATIVAIGQRVETTRVATGDIELASSDLASRTSRQAASLEETAAALGELTASAREATDQAHAVAAVARHATNAAEQGLAVASDSAEAMRAIAGNSARIGEIASLIDAIAFQTNLLALNAGVEAARAGDAGRGFAVVATEVRALAQRSAEAAKDVKEIIGSASAQVSSGVALVERSGEALKQIVAETTKVSALAKDISAVVERQSGSIGEISAALSDMNLGTQQNAAMVEETNATCVNLAREAVALDEAVRQFNTGERRAAVTKAPAPTKTARPLPRVQGNLALAEDDWADF